MPGAWQATDSHEFTTFAVSFCRFWQLQARQSGTRTDCPYRWEAGVLRRAGAVLVVIAAVSTAAGCSSGGGGRLQASHSARATPAGSAAQLTGVQLRAKLLPPSDFATGYHVEGEDDSGARLAESSTGVNLGTESCAAFVSHSLVALLGATAYAGESVGKSGESVQYAQFIWQFASSVGAAKVYRYVLALPARCPKTTLTSHGVGEQVTVLGQALAPAGGHDVVEVNETATVSGVGLALDTVWSVDGAELLEIGLGASEQGSPASPSPSLRTLMSDLIASAG
jgi:hypothetical protein